MIQPVFLFYIERIFDSLQTYWIVTKTAIENKKTTESMDAPNR